MAFSKTAGIMRRAREIPPGMTESPTGWKISYFLGMSTSCSQARPPPTQMVQTTSVAPSRASRRSVLADTFKGFSADSAYGRTTFSAQIWRTGASCAHPSFRCKHPRGRSVGGDDEPLHRVKVRPLKPSQLYRAERRVCAFRWRLTALIREQAASSGIYYSPFSEG